MLNMKSSSRSYTRNIYYKPTQAIILYASLDCDDFTHLLSTIHDLESRSKFAHDEDMSDKNLCPSQILHNCKITTAGKLSCSYSSDNDYYRVATELK